MPTERLFLSNEHNNHYLDISNKEIISLHYRIIDAYYTYLEQYGVIKLWDKKLEKKDLLENEILNSMNASEFQLIFLAKYMKKFVHKDLISLFVRSKIPAALDQQVRHLGTQKNWYVLNKGSKIPDIDEKVPSGYHYLFSIEMPNPKVVYAVKKRAGRLMAKNFDDLKIVYDNKCATCGIQEGIKDTRLNVIVKLQQGHMNPRNPLIIENTIPQCQYCNQTYKDYFVFNEYGRVIAVNNPLILLKSPKDIQDEMIQTLLEERQRS